MQIEIDEGMENEEVGEEEEVEEEEVEEGLDEEEDDKTALSRQMQMILEDLDHKSSVSDGGDLARSSVSDVGETRSLSDADRSADEEDDVFQGRDTQQAVLNSVRNMSSSNSNSSPSTKEVGRARFKVWITCIHC